MAEFSIPTKRKQSSKIRHLEPLSKRSGNRVRICSNLLKNAPFCKVVEIAAHEFGHNAYIPKDRYGAHNRRGASNPDQVYQFGFYARELCKIAYGTGFRVGDGSSPRRNPGLVAPKDIVLHPKKNFQGYPFHLSVSIINGERALERVRKRHANMDDLRFIGLNDNISSMRINRGRWKVCNAYAFGRQSQKSENEQQDFLDPISWRLENGPSTPDAHRTSHSRKTHSHNGNY